jgi:integrase
VADSDSPGFPAGGGEPGSSTYIARVLLRAARVKVVSERLGHASATITLTVYQHVHSGMAREAADPFAALLLG